MVADDPDFERRQISMLQGLRRRGHAVVFKDRPNAELARPTGPDGKIIPTVKKSSFLWAFVGKLCPYCWVPMTSDGRSRATRDHILPRSYGHTLRGGKNRLVVCAACNHDKSDMTPVQFVAWLTRRNDRRASIVIAAYKTIGLKLAPVAGGAPRNYDGATAFHSIEPKLEAEMAPELKTVHAQDNPDHEKVEADRATTRAQATAQTQRDDAEKKLEQANVGAAVGGDSSFEQKAHEAQQGRGAAGQNTGPSDTRSADPKNPPGYPTRGNPTGGLDASTDGMGTSPPQGAAPKGDKPEDGLLTTERRRANFNPTPENLRLADEADEAKRRAKVDQTEARADLRSAEQRIADGQSRPAPQQDRLDRDRDQDRR